jgi:hypothetical protein
MYDKESNKPEILEYGDSTMSYSAYDVSLSNRSEDYRRTISAGPPSRSLSHTTRLSSEPTTDRMQISELVGLIRKDLHGNQSKKALNRIYELLMEEFPGDRYQPNFDIGDLENLLHEGLRENSPVVAAFLENKTKNPALWKWRIHFAEIGGASATISDMLASIKSPDIGTWRAHNSLKQPLQLEPFGRASRLWSCSSKPWQGCSISLSFFGHSNDNHRRLVSVRTPVQHT